MKPKLTIHDENEEAQKFEKTHRPEWKVVVNCDR